MVAMEAYMIDHGSYVPSYMHSKLLPRSTSAMGDIRLLSTPVSYINRVPTDPLRNGTGFWIYALGTQGVGLGYSVYPHNVAMTWSNGPDRVTQTGGYRTMASILENEARTPPRIGNQTPVEFGGGGYDYNGMRYDPTNGLISVGDIYRHIERPH